jgi:hypothetical protein
MAGVARFCRCPGCGQMFQSPEDRQEHMSQCEQCASSAEENEGELEVDDG